MFTNFPKKRIELPEEFRKIYSEHYKDNREGNSSASSAAQKMESWLHKKVAGDVNGNTGRTTLEIGAGTLNQLRYELTESYDIIEPFHQLYENSPYIGRIQGKFDDIDEIDGSKRYDRITSIATFEHITDLPKVVAKTCILLNDGGTLRVAVPNEGTWLWKLGWKLSTGLEFRIRFGLDYGILMRHEHVNTAREIEEVLKHFYSKVSCSCLGISRKFAFYLFFECSRPDLKAANEYLSSFRK
jgi:hypothetical protein